MSVSSKSSSQPRAFAPLDYVLYAVSVLVWGFSWIALHYQVGQVAPEVSVVWRFAIASPLMLLLAAIRGERLVFHLAEHRYFVGLGAAIFSTNFALFYYAGGYIASGAPGREKLPLHANGMRFSALGAAGANAPIIDRIYYSVGGGFVVDHTGAPADGSSAPDVPPESW